jgi:hypothetical protein
MSIVVVAIVVVTAVVVVGLVVAFFTGKNPAQGEGSAPPPPGTPVRDQTADRPAGPNAENMAPEQATGDGSPPRAR